MLESIELRGQTAASRPQLPEEVAAHVRELIISGAVRPGEFLRMEPIAEAVGVSNTPVREGLLTLRSEGFVNLVPRRGFVVAPFTRQDIRDLFWAQAQLAGELAARAANLATPELLAVLDENLTKYAKVTANGDRQAISDLGHQFHRHINLAAHSRRLSLLLSNMVNHLSVKFYTDIEGHVAGAGRDHPAILCALREGDARKARSLMQTHILDGAHRLLEALEERNLLPDAPHQ